jgi:hypothetical protein
MLGHAGISAIGIERETEPWPFARAVHFEGEILRLLQSLGLGDEVLAHCRPMCDFRIVNQADETLITHATGQLGSQGWPDQVLFHQPHIEPVLREEIDRLPTVELRPGMYLRAEVVLPEKSEVVAVPQTAIVHASYGDSVFVTQQKPGPDGKQRKVAQQTFVKLGTTRGDFVAVVAGLKADEEVVTAGAFKLRNGIPLKVNNQGGPKPSLDPHPENR